MGQREDEELVRKYLLAADDSGVQDAQAGAGRSNMIAGLGRAAEGFARARSQAVGGQGVDNGTWDLIRNQGQQGVADAQANRKNAMDRVLTEDKLGWQGKEREQQGKDWERKGVTQGREDEKYGRETTEYTAAHDATSAQSKAARAYYAKTFGGATGVSNIPGYDELSASDIEKHLAKPMELQERIAARKEESGQRSADRMAMMGSRREDKAIAQSEKKAEKDSLLTIPGYERDPAIGVKPEDAGKARASKGHLDALNSALDDYKKLVGENGSFEYGGEAGTRMASLATTIKMQLKNLYELGALSGPDMAIIETQITDPSSVKNFFTRDGSLQAGLDQTKKTLNEGFGKKMATMGYKSQANVSPKDGPSQGAGEAFAGGGKTVAKKLYSASRDQTKIVYSDGTEEVVSGKQ